MPAPAAVLLPLLLIGGAAFGTDLAGIGAMFLLLIAVAGLPDLRGGRAAVPDLLVTACGCVVGLGTFAAGLCLAGDCFTTRAGFLLTGLGAATGFFAGATAFFNTAFFTGLEAGLVILGLAADLGFATGLAALDLPTALAIFLAGTATAFFALLLGLPGEDFLAVLDLAIVGTLLSR